MRKKFNLFIGCLLSTLALSISALETVPLSETLQIINEHSTYDIKEEFNYDVEEKYEKLIVNIESPVTLEWAEEYILSSNMIFSRHRDENHYTFTGVIELNLPAGYFSLVSNSADQTNFNYAFSIKDGELVLPDVIDPTVKAIHQTLFQRLAEIINTEKHDEYNYHIYAAWIPLVTDLSLMISDVEIEGINCPEILAVSMRMMTADKVKQYFALSNEYTYIDQYFFNDYDIYGCWVNGKLRNHNKVVDFRIDLGGFGYLDNRKFGCAKGRCDVLNIDMGTDGALSAGGK